MTFIDDLPRAWITVALPGVGRSSPSAVTYEAFDQVPAVPTAVAGFDWLTDAEAWPGSALAEPSESAVADLSWASLSHLIGADAPADLIRLASDPNLRRRLPSAVDAYFDLADEVVDVAGGRLLHLVSDSQWVMHWSLYLGDDGRTSIVASDYPVGFHLDDDDARRWAGSRRRYFVCADSSAEFVWRWWMDNRIFLRAFVDKGSLTPTQETYLAGYGIPKPLD